jgi:hypothetical protein
MQKRAGGKSRRVGACLAGTLLLAGSAFAGRPLTIDDADPVDTGLFEFEAGALYEHASHCKHWDTPFGLTYGLLQGVEAGLGFGGQLERRTEFHEDSGAEHSAHEYGFGDLAMGAKWQLLEACPLGARHALVPSVKLPTADEDRGLGSGEADYDLTWIVSRALGEKAGVHLNLGYSWVGGPDDDVLHYGVALDYLFTDAVQWVGEVFAENELAGGSDTLVQGNTGLRWTLAEGLTVDLAGGAKLNGDVPDFTVTAGLTWAFGFGKN